MEKPEKHREGLLNCEQQTFCHRWFEEQLEAIKELYEKRISALEKDFASLKRQNHAVADILMKSSDAPISPSKKTLSKPLPPELSTEKAMQLWQKAIAAGLVDECYQPLLSNPQAALLAHVMARELNIRNKWKVFGTFWNLKHMSQDSYRALNQINGGEILKEIDHLLTK